MRFTTRAAVQAGTEVRDTAGGVSYTYADVPGLESIPCTILPVVDEKRQERMTPDEDTWSIIFGGHWPQITPSMWVLHDTDRYEIKRASTTKRRRYTTVQARRASL